MKKRLFKRVITEEVRKNGLANNLIVASKLKEKDILKKYDTSYQGYEESKVELMREEYGKNEITHKKGDSIIKRLVEAFINPFTIILLILAIISFVTDIIMAEPSKKDGTSVIIVTSMVLISGILRFVQETKSNKAAEKLKELVSTTTTVIRNGKTLSIPIKEITYGDLVSLSAGDMIPADLRLIESKDFYVSQSSLTGESEAIKKSEISQISKNTLDSISDLDTICFMGTNVISGYAKGIVIKVGDATYFGKIAHTISFGKPKTVFQKGIESVSKLLIKFMLIMIPLTFLVNAWKHDTVTAFTFAVAIAIGITPLLLPVILSSSLAKGAIRMSKKQTIVKRLDSIQSFGAMNILCTDKTGTLTEDKIVLEKYLDIHGQEDKGVLQYAFLNAFFQSGLKGNIDEAILNRAKEEAIIDISKQYCKKDEIPFDFSRRRLSVVVAKENVTMLITKGAVEEILSICTKVNYQGEISHISSEIKTNIKSIAKKLNEDGLRVVAVCQKEISSEITSFSISDESNMTLVGFIGFLDPPKQTAKETIQQLNSAGIRVIVLTGDNAEVTKSVCSKVGINASKIILGSQIDKLSDIAVARLLRKVSIFAKLSPIQKARLVRLLKEMGNTVGYMGDRN